MRRERIRAAKFCTVFIAVILVLYMIQYLGLLPRIGASAALPLVPLLIFIGAFFGEWIGGIFGIITGCLMDVTASDPVCFNMLALFFLGVLAGLLVKYYFNRNILTAMLLDVLLSLLYFFIKWLASYAALPSGSGLFFSFALPSAVYTAIIGVPLYFLIKKIHDIFYSQEDDRL